MLNRNTMKTILALAAVAGLAGSANAALFTWDANGGNGTWNSTNSNWWNGSTAAWGATTDTAVFASAKGGTVTMGYGTTIGQATFSSVGGVGYTIDTNGYNQTWSILTGSGSFTKAGTGTLTVNGAGGYAGAVTLSNGTLAIGSASALGTGAVTLNGGTLGIASGLTVSNNLYANPSTTSGVVLGLTANGSAVTLSGGSVTGSGTVNFTTASATSTTVHKLPTLSSFTGTVGMDTSQANVYIQMQGTGLANATLNLTGGTSGGFLYRTDTNVNTTIAIGALTGTGKLCGTGSGGYYTTYQIGGLNSSTTFSGLLAENSFNATANTYLEKVGTGTLTLSGANTYKGTTKVSGGTLKLDYSTNSTNVIGSNSALTMQGGTLYLLGKSSGTSAQTVNGLTVGAGGSTIVVDGNGGSGTTLTLGAITSSTAGGALNFTTNGTTTITSTTNKNGQNIYGGRVTFNGGDWATTASGTSPYTLSAYSGYSAMAASGTDTNNSRITAGASLSGALTTNTLKIENPAASQTLALGANTLTLTAGGLLVTGANATAISGTTGVLTASNGNGAYDLVIHQYNTGGLTVSAIIGNNGANATALTKAGTGTLTLTATNSYTGVTTIGSGTLEIGNSGTLGSAGTYTANITDNGRLLVNTSANQTFSTGVIGGFGSLAKSGSGTLTLSGANTYTGGTTLSNGTLVASNASALGTGTVTLGGGTLSVGGNLTLANNFSAASGATTAIALGTASGADILNGSLAGDSTTTVNLSSASAGSITVHKLPSLTVFNGTLGIDTSQANVYYQLQGSAANTTVNLTGGTSGGYLYRTDIASSSVIDIGALSGNGKLAAGNTSNKSYTTTYRIGGLGTSTTFSGVLSNNTYNSLTPLCLAKTGSGTLAITGSSSYTGGTTVSQGTLRLGHANAMGSTAGSLTVAGGTLDLYGNSPTVGSLAGAAGAAITDNAPGSGTTTLTVNQAGNAVYGGAIQNGASRVVGLTKSGSGVLTLTGSNSYTGTTTISGGTIRLQGASTYPGSMTIMPIGDSITAGFDGASQTVTGGYRAPLYNSLNSAGVNFTFVGANNADPGSLPAAQQWHSGYGSYRITDITNNLNGNSSPGYGDYNQGGYWITGGHGTTRAAVTPDVILLTIGANDIINSVGSQQTNLHNLLTSLTTLLPTTKILVADITPMTSYTTSVNTYNGYVNTEVASFITAGKNVSKVDLNTGFDTSTGLSNDNIHPSDLGYAWMANQWYSALSAIYAGGGTCNGLSATPVNISVSGASLDVNGTQAAIASLTGVAGSAVTLGNGRLTVGDATSTTFAGVIGDAGGYSTSTGGSLVKTGSGTLTLSGVNTYTGGTTVNNGTLAITSVNAVGGTSGIHLSGNGILDYTGAAASLAKNITVTSGTGIVSNTGSGTLELSGTLTKSGTVLTLTGSRPINVTGTIVGNGGSFNSDLVVTATTVTLSNTNSYVGPTYVYNGGTLENGIANALPTDTVLTLGDGSNTAGTYKLNGYSQSIAGLTNVGSGAALVANGGATDSTLTLTGTGAYAYGGLIQDGGAGKLALAVNTTGSYTLSGSNSYSGGTTLTAGTLTISNPNALGIGPVAITGGTLNVGGNAIENNIALNGGAMSYTANAELKGNLTGTGALTVNCDLTLSGSNSYSGGTTISGGTSVLTFAAGALPSGSTITFGNGGDAGGTLKWSSVNPQATVSNNMVVADSGIASFDPNGQTVEVSGSISGSGNLYLTGNGSLTLSGVGNSYTGYTYVQNGTLKLGRDNAITNNATPDTNNGNYVGMVAVDGTLNLNGHALATNALGEAIGGGAIINSGTLATLTLGCDNSLAIGGSLVVPASYSGSIDGAISLVKIGSNSQLLSGSNSYTGTTTVSGGTLVAGSANAFGNSAITVTGGTLDLNGNVITNNITLNGGTLNNGSSSTIGVNNLALGTAGVVNNGGKDLTVAGTLSGSGTINANSVTAATIAPGNSPGLDVITGTLVLSNGQSYDWQVLDATGVAGTGYDSVTAGTLDLSGLTAGGYAVNVQSLTSISPDVQGTAQNFDPKKNYSWTLFGYTNLSGTFNSNLFALTTTNFEGADKAATWSVTNVGNTILLNYMVPEPGTLGLLALGALALLGRRRGRQG